MGKRILGENNQINKREAFVLICITFFLFGSIITYNKFDTCINVIGSSDTKNIFGSIGAYVADIIIQLFGYACIVPLFYCFYNLFYLLTKKKNVFRRIKKFYVLSTTVLLSFLLCFFSSRFYFLSVSGGFVGNLILKFFDKHLLFEVIAICISIIIVLLFPYVMFVFDKNIDIRKIKNNRRKFSIQWFIIANLSFVDKILKFLSKVFKIIFFLPLSFIRKKQSWADVDLKKISKIEKMNESKKIQIINSLNKVKNNFSIKKKDDKDNKVENIQQNNIVYTKPVPSLLKVIEQKNSSTNTSFCRENMQKLAGILGDFGVRGTISGYRSGPIVTLYEFKPQAGIKASRVISLCDDLARTMMVSSVRISTIAGRDTLGIEVPNKDRSIVCFRRLIESEEYENTQANIPMILGCNIFGKPIVADLTTMPHLLIAGTTGSGKSVGINGMVLSMLYKLSPEQCRLIMIDPKMLEFSAYADIPHLLLPVIVDAKDAVLALKWVVREMENRYKLMSEVGVRNISGYNEKVAQQERNEIDTELKRMEYIVVIIDEMADLMVVAGKEIEVLVQRLSQMARAAGIHLIMATQRPSVDVITGVIKANFPTRISYQVTSKIDSRTILGEQGAEQLLGKGDLLFMPGGTKTLRIHGPFISDDEVEAVVSYLKKYNNEPQYINLVRSDDENNGGFTTDEENGDSDDMYKKAVSIVLNDKKTSISYLQRKLRIGYNKAANYIEKMEQDGILSEPDRTGKRIIISDNND